MEKTTVSPPSFSLDFPRAWNAPLAKGVIKQQPEDFYVEELLTPDLAETLRK